MDDASSELSIYDETPRAPRSSRKGSKSARPKAMRPSTARHSSTAGGSKSLQEMQAELLRRTYRGITTQSANTESFTGLDPLQRSNMSFASTSHYLRQTTGFEKPKPSDLPTGKSTQRTPAYKTPEEYYDEVIALKKQIQQLTNDNSMMKLKLRRVEEDYIKKRKEVEQLLDPVKNDEVRRTLADTKPESGMVVHSLKQKILKLEEQVREKEAAFSKLQSDLKTTKTEELKVALEVCYNEIQRLRTEKLVETSPRKSTLVKESPSRLKALTVQLMKANVEKNRILLENKSLREDLQRFIEKNHEKNSKVPSTHSSKEYEDMNKKELLAVIARLEKKYGRRELETEEVSGDREHSKSVAVEGKVALEGTTNQRLDTLDKRETELLKELEKQTALVKKLKEDRVYYRTKSEEKDEEIKNLKKELDDYQRQTRSAGKSSAPNSPRSVASQPSLQRRNSSTDREQRRKVEDFRQNHAARRIQTEWRNHRDNDAKTDEAAEMIQSAIRGHQQRRQNMTRLRRTSVSHGPGGAASRSVVHDDLSTDEDSGVDETAEFLQSNIRAHNYRKQQIARRAPSPANSRRNSRSRVASDDELDNKRTTHQTPGKTVVKNARRQSPVGRSRTPLTDNFSDDDDDDLVVAPRGRAAPGKKFF